MSDEPEERAPGPFDALWLSLYAAGMMALTRALDVVTLAFHPRLLPAYLATWRASLATSPFAPRTFEKVHIARRGGLSLRELVYGESPLFTVRRLLRRAGADERSVVLDPLAGRGRALLGARALGAAARGVELVPSHVEAVARALERAGVELSLGDGALADLSDVTHVYLTWTCMSEQTRARFAQRLAELEPGAVVITLTVPLAGEAFEVTQRLTGLFTWGFEPVYVQVRKGGGRPGAAGVDGEQDLSPGALSR